MNKLIVTDVHKEMLFEIANNQFKNIKRFKLMPGHEVFRFHVEDGVIDKALYNITTETNSVTKRSHRNIRINFDAGYIYMSALNLKTAHKQAAKIIMHVIYRCEIEEAKKVNEVPPSLLSLVQGDENKSKNNP